MADDNGGRAYYTAQEVARLASCTPGNIRRLYGLGRMRGVVAEVVPAPHGGVILLFPRDAVDAWLPTRVGPGRPRKVQP